MVEMRTSFLLGLVVVVALGAGCSSGGDDDDDDAIDAPAVVDAAGGEDGGLDAAGACTINGHTEDMNGVCHGPGKEDPLANCTSCHGASLQGGAAPSCYTCHDNSDHTINRAGHMHRSGTADTCTVCHGPNNTGGLGPACSTCH